MRKTILLLAFFCAILVQNVSAQYVSLPDTIFRKAMKEKYPNCYNPALNKFDTICLGNSTHDFFNTGGFGIYNMEGIQYCKKLKTLFCNSNQLTSLPKLPSGLTMLKCDWNKLTALPTLPDSLVSIYAVHNKLTALPTLPNSLKSLFVENNYLTSLPVLPDSLLELGLNKNLFTLLPAPLPSKLTILTCGYNKLTTNLTFPNTLTRLECDSLPLVVWQNLPPNLEILFCNNTQITALPPLPSKLDWLFCSNNYLTNLPPLPNNHMDRIYLDNNQLTNLPELGGLRSLVCSNNPALSHLPDLPSNMDGLWINGTNISCLPVLPSTMQSLRVNNLINCLPNKPQNLGAPANTLPLCNPTNNNNQCVMLSRMSGYVFNDLNNNGVKNTGETGRAGVRIEVPAQNYATYTDNTGFYELAFNEIGTYHVASIVLPTYYTCTQDTQTVTFTSSDQNITRNFPVIAQENVKDFAVELNNYTVARPGFPLHFSLRYENVGTVIGNATIKFAKPALYTVSSTSVSHTIVSDTLVWNLNNVPTGKVGHINIYGKMSASANLGSIQNFYASVNQSDTSDNVTEDNRQFVSMTVVGSYDPNDKQGKEKITPMQVVNGEYIDYTIRFQNTGTYSAQNVVVVDTLANTLQTNTLKLVAGSHSVMRTKVKGNVVRFEFMNIMLPDSTTNEKLSHGYVKFRIKPKNNLVLGNTIQNKAAIYFDYNVPIITNTVTTTVAIPTGIAEKISNRLEVFPNPLEGEMLTIPNMRGASAKLFTITGQELRSWTNISEQISLQNIASGMYLLEVSHNSQRRTAKVVVK